MLLEVVFYLVIGAAWILMAKDKMKKTIPDDVTFQKAVLFNLLLWPACMVGCVWCYVNDKETVFEDKK